MGGMYSAPRLRLAPPASRPVKAAPHEQGVLRTPATATAGEGTGADLPLPSLSASLAAVLAQNAAAEGVDATREALAPRVVEAFVRAAVQDVEAAEQGAKSRASSSSSSASLEAKSSPRHRPRRTLSSDSLPTLRAQALASAMARPGGGGAAVPASWRAHAGANAPKQDDVQGDLRRWRSCGAGALASGTQSSKFERRPRYRGSSSDEGRAAKSEVRVHRGGTEANEHILHGPARAVQPPGGLMVRRLSLAGCELASDEALATVLRVTDLTQLSLERCVRLTDAALEAIGTQLSLRELSLASCRLVGNEGVAHLHALTKLRVLSLERCGRVTDDGIAASLSEWRQLQVLNVGFCFKVTAKSLCGVAACRRLAYLDVRSTRATSDLWSALRGLVRLRALYASNTALSDAQSDAVEALPSLRALDVAGTQVGDGLLSHLAQLPLETLNLAYTGVSNGGVAKHVTKMRSLRWLSLDDTEVGDYAVERMGSLTSLTSLNVADTQVTAFGVGAVVALSALRSLDLSFTGVTDAALRAVSRLACLRRLAADGEHVTDKGAAHIAALSNLRELELYGAAVTDIGVTSIARCSQLRTLELCLARVGDDGARAIADGLRELRVLNLSQNRVGSQGVLALLRGCRVLDTLNVAYCHEVAGDVVPDIIAHPTLACVCLQGTLVGISTPAPLRRTNVVVVSDTEAYAQA